VAETLILGLGNELLRDDAVGLLAARRLKTLVGRRADLREATVATIDLLPLLKGYRRVLLLDAFLDEGTPPGLFVRWDPERLPRGSGYRSLHSMTLGEMLELGRLVGWPMPREIVLHGLRVEDPFTFGTDLTPVVREAWPRWVEAIAAREFGLPVAL
jgi:hydrogenase maturation protease